jgi:hypothetical protein
LQLVKLWQSQQLQNRHAGKSSCCKHRSTCRISTLVLSLDPSLSQMLSMEALMQLRSLTPETHTACSQKQPTLHVCKPHCQATLQQHDHAPFIDAFTVSTTFRPAAKPSSLMFILRCAALFAAWPPPDVPLPLLAAVPCRGRQSSDAAARRANRCSQ